MITELLEKKETKCKREFKVSLIDGKPRTNHGQLKLRIIFGKVENQRIPLTDRYTTEKIVAIATGEVYQQPWDKKPKDQNKLVDREPYSNIAETAFRDLAETKIADHNSERDAIIQTIRELACNVYENTVGVYGVRPETVFTQIMLGLIIGDEPPTPPVRGSPSPLHRTRKEIQTDFIAGASSERVKRLQEEL